jgi:hypothetical protein
MEECDVSFQMNLVHWYCWMILRFRCQLIHYDVALTRIEMARNSHKYGNLTKKCSIISLTVKAPCFCSINLVSLRIRSARNSICLVLQIEEVGIIRGRTNGSWSGGTDRSIFPIASLIAVQEDTTVPAYDKSSCWKSSFGYGFKGFCCRDLQYKF